MTPEAAAAILNVNRDATATELKAAHRSRSRMWHPDRFADGTDRDREEAAVEFIRITAAYELLVAASDTWSETPTAAEPAANDSTAHAATPVSESSLREYLGFGPTTAKPGRVRAYFGFGNDK